jgi:uncharacterized membrane protein YccC
MPVDQSTDSEITKNLVKPAPQPPWWKLMWRTLTRFDRAKLIPLIAFRNTLGVAIPLIIGVLTGSVLSGVAIATGALNVSYSDGADPYSRRAHRMLVSCFLTASAVLIGGLTGHQHILASAIAALWSMAAGLAVALGTTAADLGVLSLVTLVVYSAQPLTPQNAAWAGLLALVGGLFQTALALLFWPIQRYQPERRALGLLYSELAHLASSSVEDEAAPPASQASTQAQEMLSLLNQDRRIESDRYRALLNQAERARLCLLILLRLRRRLLRDEQSNVTSILNRFLEIGSDILYAVSQLLIANDPLKLARQDLAKLTVIADELRGVDRTDLPPFVHAMIDDMALQMDALAGQLRAIVDLSESTTPEGNAAFFSREERMPRALRILNTAAILRANLTLKSAACRHAIRLSICLLIGDAIGRAVDWRRSYWLPMTIAIVLKPDFTATFSRGVLRLAGTFAGLTLATIIIHFFHPPLLLQAILVAFFTYGLRWVGPANYGIFVVCISALIVFLVGMTGVSASLVISARAQNTAAGGLLALFAYWIWPTWEKTQVREAFARLLDSYRAYFNGIVENYKQGAGSESPQLDSLRLAARLARSNAEASAERLSAEPGVPRALLRQFVAMLATSHRLIHALMALEAGISRSNPAPPRPAFHPFAKDVDLTFYFLSAGLRGSPYVRRQLPDLREDHRRLIASGDPRTERYALVNVETDRITNSVNTLEEQISHLLAESPWEPASK